jgi:hypothetical protein
MARATIAYLEQRYTALEKEIADALAPPAESAAPTSGRTSTGTPRTYRRHGISGGKPAETELLQIRIEEKKRTLVGRDAVDALIDSIAGTVLTPSGRHVGAVLARNAGPARHRRGGGSDQARDSGGLSRQGE